MIDEDLDRILERMAHKEHTSKAALIRRFVRERVQPLPPIEDDPLWEMVGVDDYEPESIDDVVYGRDTIFKP
ncbi:MAG TPA: CopG family transcriptional regulator [Actinomycetota bacterium]|nr:CopG family transcriptional regulator [Actinomycetota bacterium]